MNHGNSVPNGTPMPKIRSQKPTSRTGLSHYDIAMIDIEAGLNLIRIAVAKLDTQCGIRVYDEALVVEEAVATMRFTARMAPKKGPGDRSHDSG